MGNPAFGMRQPWCRFSFPRCLSQSCKQSKMRLLESITYEMQFFKSLVFIFIQNAGGVGVDVSRWGSQGRSGPVAGPHRLGAVRSIDADVLRREVAGPEPRHGLARVQIHNQWNMLSEKLVACGALVEIERLATPQDRGARHFVVH